MTISTIVSDIDKHFNIGYAIVEVTNLNVVHRSSNFNTWFELEANQLKHDIHSILPELNLERFAKRMLKKRDYKMEVELDGDIRKITLSLIFSKISEDYILVKVTDNTKLKELEYMMDSYSNLAEKAKKDLEKANSLIEAQNRRMMAELEIARQVQRGMLPFEFDLDNKNIQFAAMLQPAREVAGDFFERVAIV